MPAWRRDPLTGSTVVVAAGRGVRPVTFGAGDGAEPAPAPPAGCPFCPGNEHDTPPEVARTGPGAPDTPGWRIRVVPNKFPIVDGGHEVVVLSPAHERSLAELPVADAAAVLRVLRDRSAHHLGAGRAVVQCFVNHGRAGGASIEHPHAQLVALDHVPDGVRLPGRLADDEALAREHGLMVLDGDVRVWCPWASTWPFEAVVAADRAPARYVDASDDLLDAVAATTVALLHALASAVGDVPYNLVWHEAERWFLRLTPRLTVRAGFELGTGVMVNTVDPAVAAEQLRSAVTA